MEAVVRHLRVNGRRYAVAVPDNATVLWTVRNVLGLTGTKCGCDMGTCGCCTVLIDGRAHLGCLTLAAECEGREITTIEGLAAGGALHPLQEAFHRTGAQQCGFCTPGFLLTAVALLSGTPDPTEEQIREAISGNLCRCTGYVKIVEAIRSAAERMKAAASAPRGDERKAIAR